uniref:RING-CH-type domain-containing protein n=2 Tax=Macrostomum lignano TaxID=282301 RepID=A0A1I8H8D2_9PLAT
LAMELQQQQQQQQSHHHQASGLLRSAQSCEDVQQLIPNATVSSSVGQSASSGNDQLMLSAAREERATSTVLPSSQQAATSTSDLLDACGGVGSGIQEGCPLVVWHCRSPSSQLCDQQQHMATGSAECAPLHLQHYQHQLPVSAGVSPDTADSQADICRICHCPDTDPAGDNPLISPCLCSGSLKYVHRDCLQHWVKSQDIKVCELCKFGFVMRVTTKPISEWRKLDISSLERRKIICSVSFHIIALTCVIWSLYVLIEKTSAEINSGKLEWPFWTKLVVVAIGFTGGTVFMYVQCRTYFGLCRRWRSFNRTFLIQSASEEELSRARALAKARPPRRSSDYCSDELV